MKFVVSELGIIMSKNFKEKNIKLILMKTV